MQESGARPRALKCYATLPPTQAEQQPWRWLRLPDVQASWAETKCVTAPSGPHVHATALESAFTKKHGNMHELHHPRASSRTLLLVLGGGVAGNDSSLEERLKETWKSRD